MYRWSTSAAIHCRLYIASSMRIASYWWILGALTKWNIGRIHFLFGRKVDCYDTCIEGSPWDPTIPLQCCADSIVSSDVMSTTNGQGYLIARLYSPNEAGLGIYRHNTFCKYVKQPFFWQSLIVSLVNYHNIIIVISEVDIYKNYRNDTNQKYYWSLLLLILIPISDKNHYSP